LPKPPKVPAPFPTKEEVLTFIRESPRPVGAREIARAFHIRGSETRIAFKRLLKEIHGEGAVDRHKGRKLSGRGGLPAVAVIEVSDIDEDGELLARPVVWHGEEAPPTIYVAPERHGTPAIEIGTRLLARLKRSADGAYEALPIRVIAGRPQEIIGIFTAAPRGGTVRSTDRRHKSDFFIAADDALAARTGDLVRAEVAAPHERGQVRAKIVQRLGHAEDPDAISLIAIHSHDIPVEFPQAALAEAEAAGPCPLGTRSDLRTLPLVTIDGPDARDFDDAVFAEPDPASDNRGGWHMVVAIADVGHYVRAGAALDTAAYDRGNSVYFPDRVVPMLPEALSNGLCSLKPGEERACLAVRMTIDREGNKRSHRFERGLMRSAARLTYEQVEAARYRATDDIPETIAKNVIAPLYGAYDALLAARRRRGTLDLDLPEPKVEFSAPGKIARIQPALRFDSHRLIEEFMIAANVAAAESLEAAGEPAMYRIHDRPDPEKVEALRDFLDGIGYRLPKGQVIQPKSFTGILDQARQHGHTHLVSELVLRTQAQAQYAPENIGHFGLALRRYCHFTSPIRRYADLLVHRALIRGLRLGPDGLRPDDAARFPEWGEHISTTERRAVAAERDAMDRYTVAFMEDKVGTIFPGRITGVTRFGLFVRIEETGAQGLIPMRSLGDDFYIHDEAHHCLVGRRTGRQFTLGDAAAVRLIEAEAVTGGLLFEIAEFAEEAVETGAPRPMHPKTRRFGPVRRGRKDRSRTSKRRR
jgi:ribonuclease R